MTTDEATTYDVVVVGAGGAGLAAAVEAADHGASVLLLEKNPIIGGSTGMSIGALTAAGTALQRRVGIHDTVDALREDLNRYAGPLAGQGNPEMQEILINNLTPTFEWLQRLGVSFLGPFKEGAHSVPRMHSAIPSGKSYIRQLTRAAKERGVQILCSVQVNDVLKDTGGRVTGVAVEDASGTREFHARRGVILTTGDYSASLELKRQYYDPAVAELDALNPTSTGDGHRMGSRAGGALLNMELNTSTGLRFPQPPPEHSLYRWEALCTNPSVARCIALLARVVPQRMMQPFMRMVLTCHMAPEVTLYRAGCILVNDNGERFANEVVKSPTELVPAVGAQPNRHAWVILDSKLARKFSRAPNGVSTAPGVGWAFFSDYRRTRSDIIYQGQTLRELAGKVGLPEEAFEGTVETYNRSVVGAGPDPVGRPAEGQPLLEPPYYAMGPLIACQQTTKGGLAVNSSFRVLDDNKQTIPGLYAAGYTGMGGLMTAGHGVSVGWAFLTGRIAGQAAARDPEQSDAMGDGGSRPA